VVNDLQELMRQNVVAPPPDLVDLDGLVAAGRQRARRRRRGRLAAGGAVVLTVGVVAAGTALWPSTSTDSTGPEPADRPPAAHGPTISLGDATRAVEGKDYRVLARHTNADLDTENGQYFDGVTDDGQILLQDGPREPDWSQRLALVDPATGEKDWLPDPHLGQEQFWPVELGADNLVLLSLKFDGADGLAGTLSVRVFDRDIGAWSTLQWSGLPEVRGPNGEIGPDGRLYVLTPATTPGPPPGGWPTAPDGDAEDADAEGETSHLWSVSLTDTSDVRDEQQIVGAFAFTDDAMVWTDGSNGAPGRVHVRDLASGEERSFDPHTGERCNLLGFGASGDRIMMSQYCGTYDGEVRDDRVQVLSTSGEPVVTLQDSGIDGKVAGGAVVVESFGRDGAGTYVYELDQDRLLRVSDGVSNYGMGGPTPEGLFLWHTPVNHRHGAEQWLGQLLD
jgi:hypothetical protein